MFAIGRRGQRQPYDWGEERDTVQKPIFLGADSIPAVPVHESGFVENLKKVVRSGARSKPVYADCWMLPVEKAEVLEEYDAPSGHVAIGIADDGEYLYTFTPAEYSCADSVNMLIAELIESVRVDFRTNGGRTERHYIERLVRDLMVGEECSPLLGEKVAVSSVCDIVYRYTVGLGIFDALLSDQRIEDIYVDAPAEKNKIYVTLSGIGESNAHVRCRTNLVSGRREVANLLCHLKKSSGLPFCESNPVLETDMPAFDARVTVVGYPMSPLGDAVAIRKRSSEPWTLTRLIANGTISAETAALLSFLVQNRATILVCGARGAGKSSLLSALLFELGCSTRLLCIEDCAELPTSAMRRLGYKVQSIVTDAHLDGDSGSRATEALRVSLRLGESSIAIGEVRGSEARTLYESMRTGRAGSAILGTIHGDSAKSVFERVVYDMGISPESFAATEILVTMGTFRDRATGAQSRRVSEIAATADSPGEFIDMSVPDFAAPVMRRALSGSGMTEKEAADDISARAMIRSFLAEVGKKYGKEYFGAEWVQAANDHVMRNTGKDAESVFRGFVSRFRSETGIAISEETSSLSG